MEEEGKLLVDSATEFHKSLKELRDFSSQLYHAADYWETAFFSSQHKRLIVENTKEYVSGAVATLVDHVGSISAILDYTVSKTTSVPQTEHKIGTLKQRIETCQQHSHKLGLPRLHWTAHFPRFHSRYTSLRLQDSAFMTTVCRLYIRIITLMSKDDLSLLAVDSERDDAKGKEGNACETNKRLTDHCKPALVESSNSNMQRKSGVSPALEAVRDYKHLLPAHEGLPVSPKAEHSAFQFQVGRILVVDPDSVEPEPIIWQLQEAQKVKRSMINWKLIKNKEIAMLIRRALYKTYNDPIKDTVISRLEMGLVSIWEKKILNSQKFTITWTYFLLISMERTEIAINSSTKVVNAVAIEPWLP
ncbi:UNVERIFIED_CONTAM: hypothetical protein Sindi_2240600 [Sesamum indicum]